MTTLKDLKTPISIVWCPGCGNFSILSAFKSALAELDLEREQVAMVTGIGCHGKIVDYVNVNGFHGIHGRVIPLATGIKLANQNLFSKRIDNLVDVKAFLRVSAHLIPKDTSNIANKK